MDKKTQKNLLELVRRNYEEIAEDFDASRKKELWPELVKLASVVKDGDRVLDAGCGNGRMLQAFGEKKISYLGVDSSKKLIEVARKNSQPVIASDQRETRVPPPHQARGRDKLRNLTDSDINQRLLRRPEHGAPRNDNKFEVADILELDKVEKNNFDYVFCIAVLHHLPGEDLRVAALKQMKGKLNKNGKIILTAWNLWSQAKFRRLIFKYGFLKLAGKNKMDFGDILFDWKNAQGQAVSRRYYHAFTENELKKTALQAGLKIEKLFKDKFNYYLVLTSSLVRQYN